MRALVLALALLAALKIWTQDTFYRSATEEALINAYRTRAASACAGLASGPGPTPDWTTQPRFVVGNPALKVHIWQVDHEQWNARFRQPFLIFPGGSGLSCTFDILAGTAEIVRS